ncbi:RHS repeat-associated core domain-containing protein [Prevotella dentasini]|uniref:RHS repeat-associated core domain-containing protein n=1 Tax=Prevotella dentasini TaxID=589537 RepID=UPI000ABC6318|nr:RHS repeat-associated core domain-containing protein [Prevotella dentasini]
MRFINGYQPYKSDGKEFDPMHGLNTYDYGARQYNPILPRWDRIDPLAEKYYNVSPYTYCANNPVRFVDLDGKELYMTLKVIY